MVLHEVIAEGPAQLFPQCPTCAKVFPDAGPAEGRDRGQKADIMKISGRQFRAATAVCAILALTACEEQFNVQTDDVPTARAQVVANASTSETVTPRPDLFSLRALAAWDGRPSLGGAWIAHPDVQSAERASITEVATGRTITAALFRRDPSIPGPPFQISAEAAQELGIQPGLTVEVDVVAVRIATADADVAEVPVEEEVPTVEAVASAPPAPSAVSVRDAPAQVQPAPRAPGETTARPAPPPAPANDAAPERPFMQVGMFGVTSNAATLVERLKTAGLDARAVPSGALSRVVVGPAQSAAELALIREALREMGFDDALAVAL